MDLSKAMWTGPKWKTKLNRLKELQVAPKETLTGVDKQELFILETHLHPVPCPLCETPVGSTESEVVCPYCGVEMMRVVPLVRTGKPGWFWKLHDRSRAVLVELWRKNNK